ncbi:hypothetical protein [Helicobacter bizzozeronii]|uniref:hypothetical protein n=1 Tax=Helicobacter bizzozeronii TaxID=56877 RepID=UPI000CF032AD|nr:hypothetical protein [Helicobacter bizzozeronii]
MVVLANEWDSDDIGGINTSQDTIKSLKHFVGLIISLESMLPRTTRPDLKQDLQEGIKDCIEHMQTVLIPRSERADKEDIPPYNPQITQTLEPTQSLKEIDQETPQLQTKGLHKKVVEKTTETDFRGVATYPKAEWIAMWQKTLRADYGPIVYLGELDPRKGLESSTEPHRYTHHIREPSAPWRP